MKRKRNKPDLTIRNARSYNKRLTRMERGLAALTEDIAQIVVILKRNGLYPRVEE